ncbi:hypothetical protein Vretimale_3918 [Volvox reticuliferus]|uniref:Uncharacterized protein n=1 Tax=Volvox reticuliferus TaxID=1737510 RepID=A0A8J4DEM2_9CHLO|nr:hypothetical protein Vretimale_3918 [Volvox reticuliferus]
MEGLQITIKGWEDGERYERQVETTDRWVLHTADELTLVVNDEKSVTITQQPKAINATRMGVGACVWEGELFLAAYLVSLPTYRYMGARVVELGAGPGLAGILLAKMGAKVRRAGVPWRYGSTQRVGTERKEDLQYLRRSAFCGTGTLSKNVTRVCAQQAGFCALGGAWQGAVHPADLEPLEVVHVLWVGAGCAASYRGKDVAPNFISYPS